MNPWRQQQVGGRQPSHRQSRPVRQNRYRPRLERLEARLAPAAVGQLLSTVPPPTLIGGQTTSLVQVLATNPALGTPGAALGFGGPLNAGTITPTVGATPLTLAQTLNASTTVLNFAPSLPTFPFARIVVIETPAAEAGNGAPAFVVLQVLVPQPVIPPSLLFALVGQQPNVPVGAASPVGQLPFSSLRGFLFPLNFPANVLNPVSSPRIPHAHSGTIAAASLEGVVYQDRNANGEQGAGEPGLGDVRVTLELWDGDNYLPVATTVTDARGHFSFTRLRPGTYRIRPATGKGVQLTGQHVRPIYVGPAAHPAGQDIGVAPRQKRGELRQPADDRSTALPLLPQSLTDRVFAEWTGSRPPGWSAALEEGPTSPDAVLSQAIAIQDGNPASEGEFSALTAAEVTALMAAVVAEFEGADPQRRSIRLNVRRPAPA
jgi:hypothetical protein